MLTHETCGRHAANVKWKSEESSGGRAAKGKREREKDIWFHIPGWLLLAVSS